MKYKHLSDYIESYDLLNAKNNIYQKYQAKFAKLQAKYSALIAEKMELITAMQNDLMKVQNEFSKDLQQQRKSKFL